MKNRIIFLIVCVLFSFLPKEILADDASEKKREELNQIYEAPGAWDSFTHIPGNLKNSWGLAFNTKPATLWTWGAIISSSVIFYIYDEKLYKHAKIIARDIGLGNDDATRTMITLGGKSFFRGPTDLGSLMHFIGDGWAQFITAGSFALYGSFNEDNRAKQTASQIMNSLFSGSIIAQVFKRSTGRQNPNRATEYRGKWKFFSDRYGEDITAHDSVPSGHFMAATSTLVVIDQNYPEYRRVMRPVSIGLLTLLGYQMTNIGVHWMSDYPLALGIGYISAISATNYGKKQKEVGYRNPSIKNLSDWQFIPTFVVRSMEDRTYGLSGIFSF